LGADASAAALAGGQWQRREVPLMVVPAEGSGGQAKPSSDLNFPPHARLAIIF